MNGPIDDPFIPAATHRAHQIQQAIGMNHLLKGRVIQDLFAPQLAYCQANHRSIVTWHQMEGMEKESHSRLCHFHPLQLEW